MFVPPPRLPIRSSVDKISMLTFSKIKVVKAESSNETVNMSDRHPAESQEEAKRLFLKTLT